MGLLQRKVDMQMSRATQTTDPSTGIILEASERVRQMNDPCSDNVAAARLLAKRDGTKTTAPGITSSLLSNKGSRDSKLPLLKNLLCGFHGNKKTNTDSSLLKIKGELPNKFRNFSEITTHTFPDLFPTSLKDIDTHPL